MRILSIDHVQLAMPRGEEDKARRFYGEVLGLAEVEKPAVLRCRGGVWFASGSAHVHLGVQRDFTPATKAHPAFVVVSLTDAISALQEGGAPVSEPENLEGRDRVFTADPFGNRIELIGGRK